MSPDGPVRARAIHVLEGIALLARGRADGLSRMGDGVGAFLNSLAPLVAFSLVASLVMLLNGEGAGAISDLLATTCALLAPPVLSYPLARRWGRDALWLRFAIAFNWCQWAIPIVLVCLLIAAGMLMGMGVPSATAAMVAVIGLLGYAFWLHWFLARNAMHLGVWQAVLVVVCMNVGTGVLVAGPVLLEQAIFGDSASDDGAPPDAPPATLDRGVPPHG